MGLPTGFGRTCKYNPYAPAVSTAPDLKRFEILDLEAFGVYVAVKVKYHGVTNFEGVKVLVYRATEDHIREATTLDPHFDDTPGALTPLARFRPDGAGWEAATLYASMKG